MNTFCFTKKAKRLFLKWDAATQQRIREKLQELKKHPAIFSVLEPMIDMDPATHRLRIGDYRLLLRDENDGMFLVLKVGHRREIYR
ncbi:MAG: type II toxin-antitoxin system RelE/ParE family toxin [Candidatus Peregrinibacteria bacterium]